MAVTCRSSTGNLIKKACPYVALVTFYAIYLIIGSFIFEVIESRKEKDLINELQMKEDDIKDDIRALFANRSSGDENKDAEKGEDDKLEKLLKELVETVGHPDWIPGRIDEASTPDPWSFQSAMFFCMTTITTIGYGDLVPATTLGRVVVILYSFIGVPLSFIVFTVVGGLTTKLLSCIVSKVKTKCCRQQKPSNSVNGSYGSGADDQANKTEKGTDETSSISPFVHQLSSVDSAGDGTILLVIFLMPTYLGIGAALFKLTEGWKIGESFYFTFITMTTIGFGDYIPIHHFENSTYIPCLFYTLVGVCLNLMCMTLLQIRFVKWVIKLWKKISSCCNECRGNSYESI